MSELNYYVNLAKNYGLGHPVPKSVHFENVLGGQNIKALKVQHLGIKLL